MKLPSLRGLAPLLYVLLTVSLVRLTHAQEPAILPPEPPQWSVLEDADQDGLTDWDEFILYLDPLNPLDGLSDVDGDELWLAWEWQLGTDSGLADTDGDGWSDSLEVLLYGTDPLDPASKPPGNNADNDGDLSAALEPEQISVTEEEPPPPPPPTLSNGDFSDIGIQNWKDQSRSKSYQGGGFKWGEGTAASWSAYVGSTIEVWQANGETFVELDGNATSYGIKQPIANARAGAFILAWKQSGRNDTKSGTNPYYVRIYYEGESGPVVISDSKEFSGYSKLQWADNAHIFQITPAQIAAAAGKPIYVAFIPNERNNYGTLIDKVRFVPMDLAPEVLAVNSDFDEGRVDPATGYAIPDCDDASIALEAVRDHLDGKFAVNERITDDLHPNFFGVNPSQLDDAFWNGAIVTIRKLNKIDPATGHLESGQIRLYGKWGAGASEYRAIVPYDIDTHVWTSLAAGGINGVVGESVYGSASAFPVGTTYFIEGVHPGKITLEWRYQKGSIDLKYEQEFEVCTHQNAILWKADLAYKIRLETSNDPSGEINTRNIMLPSESYRDRMERISEYYDFYQDCFLTPMRTQPLHPQAMTWPGLARLAGSQVVGGLSDSEYARQLLKLGSISGYALPPNIVDDLLKWSASETEDLQQALFTGGYTIFRSIGWQMHAYRSSGYRALDWVASVTGEREAFALTTVNVWKDLRVGILNHDKVLLDDAAAKITEREQNVTIVPTWTVISGLFGGTTNWMFSVLGENSSTPAGLDFSDFFPQFPTSTGSLINTADRWKWIQPTTVGGILDTWNKLPVATRDALVGRTLEQDARRFSLISHFPVPLTIPVVFPVWVWDYEDIK